jgi:ATP-dependent Clp protease ATP-binding subunit ClpA
VILVDEIEKAHIALLDILLGIMGDGRITDSQGTEASLRNFMVIMTSNVGADARVPMGFNTNSYSDSYSNVPKILTKWFRPEFLSRIDSVFEFNTLGVDILQKVYQEELLGFTQRMAQKNITVVEREDIKEKILLGKNPREIKSLFRKYKGYLIEQLQPIGS